MHTESLSLVHHNGVWPNVPTAPHLRHTPGYTSAPATVCAGVVAGEGEGSGRRLKLLLAFDKQAWDKVHGGVECGVAEDPSSDGQVARGPWPEAGGAGMNGGVEECDGLAEELAVDIDMQLPGTTV